MAALRTLPRLTASLAPRAATRAPTSITKRFLNTDTAPILYTAHTRTTGARNGHIEGAEGLVVDLTMPSALGGKSVKGKTNPEELFSAGYAACFQSAMNITAKQMGVKIPEDSTIECDVHLVGSLKEVDLGIRVDMKVTAKGVDKAKLEKVIARTKEVCPYSRATKGNVTTTVEAVV
jgi:Ohr subfamily peroxiredoxin